MNRGWAAIAALAACMPSYAFVTSGAEAGDDATVEASADSAPDVAGDAAPDGACSALDAAPPATPQTLLAAEIGTVTGNAQQQHLVYATNSARWWLFYIDSDGRKLKTRWSRDFVSWTDGAALSLPRNHGGEGRNFSVAYRDFGGRDIVHVATALHDEPKRVVYDTRATIDCDTITFGTPVFVHDYDDVVGVPDSGIDAGTPSPGGCDPDGTGVAIGADGRVYVIVAWVAVYGCCTCDSNVYAAPQADDGQSWDGGGGAPWTLSHFTVGGTSNAHQVLAFSTGNMLAGWESADDIPPSNVSFGTGAQGQWDGPGDVFPVTGHRQAGNDWSICRIDDDHVHILRRALPDDASASSRVFDHAVFTGAAWVIKTSPQPLADLEGAFGSGVVLVASVGGLVAATIGTDAASTVRYARWSEAAGWSAWKPITTTTATRAYLSGTGCSDPAHAALVWTEGVGPYQVAGVSVAGLP